MGKRMDKANIQHLRRRFGRILRLLEGMYGPQPWKCWGKGVDVLVETILSQNTSAANSIAGFKRLRREFRSWKQVAEAPVERVEKCIRISGLSRIKAPRIRGILRQIRVSQGKIDLEFLREWPAKKAFDYLMAFDGVGPKTANCVLLFSFGMALFPVDTHIHRIAIRLGIIPERTTAEQAHDLLVEMIAPEQRYSLHVLLITHGRQTCRARNPLCERCCLLGICPTGKKILEARPPRDGEGTRRDVAPRGGK